MQAGGQGFEPPHVHQNANKNDVFCGDGRSRWFGFTLVLPSGTGPTGSTAVSKIAVPCLPRRDHYAPTTLASKNDAVTRATELLERVYNAHLPREDALWLCAGRQDRGPFQDPRLIQPMASRLIVQEDLVSEIADTFMSVVKPLGCVARATGRHDCVAVRGVKCHEAQMTTVALRGVFRGKPYLVEEFHQVLTKVDR